MVVDNNLDFIMEIWFAWFQMCKILYYVLYYSCTLGRDVLFRHVFIVLLFPLFLLEILSFEWRKCIHGGFI